MRKAFTLVFAIGGLAAAIAGVLSGVYFNDVSPDQGTSLLIFAFIVVVIGGLGSIGGSAVAAVVVALVQQYMNYYGSAGMGDLVVDPAARGRAARAPARLRRRRGREARMSRRRLLADWIWPLAVFGALAVVPALHVSIPKLFDQPVSSPGTLALLASCLVYGAFALTYDLQFGYTGLLSFGHALYIALGVYLSNIAITDWHWSFWPSILFTVAVSFIVANVLGFVSLRVTGIAFAMVTLAFAQAGAVLVLKDPHQLDTRRGGPRRRLHEAAEERSSASSTRRTSTGWRSRSWRSSSSPSAGRSSHRLGTCLAGDPRERAARRGARHADAQVQAALVRARLVPRDGGGVVYMLLVNGVDARRHAADFTLTLLLMVVIGGAGTLWGAVLGGDPLHVR